MTVTQALILELPVFTIAAGTPLVRIHRRDREPWHFSRGPGRFDPLAAAAGLGACYAAEDELAAFVEVFRRTATVSESELETRRLAELQVSEDVTLVDLTSRAAALRGPDTSSLSTDWDYAASQAFAAAAAGAGRGGVRYFARHDPGKHLICNAVFGASDDPRFSHATSRALSQQVVRRAHAEFGYRVVPVP